MLGREPPNDLRKVTSLPWNREHSVPHTGTQHWLSDLSRGSVFSLPAAGGQGPLHSCRQTDFSGRVPHAAALPSLSLFISQHRPVRVPASGSILNLITLVSFLQFYIFMWVRSVEIGGWIRAFRVLSWKTTRRLEWPWPRWSQQLKGIANSSLRSEVELDGIK